MQPWPGSLPQRCQQRQRSHPWQQQSPPLQRCRRTQERASQSLRPPHLSTCACLPRAFCQPGTQAARRHLLPMPPQQLGVGQGWSWRGWAGAGLPPAALTQRQCSCPAARRAQIRLQQARSLRWQRHRWRSQPQACPPQPMLLLLLVVTPLGWAGSLTSHRRKWLCRMQPAQEHWGASRRRLAPLAWEPPTRSWSPAGPARHAAGPRGRGGPSGAPQVVAAP